MIHDLGQGGAERVLVNMVNNMDQRKFDITVQTIFDVGIHRKSLKPHIRYKSCFKKMVRGNSHLMKLFSPRFLYRTLIREEYDIVVSYLEGPSARILSGCPYPSQKVCWLHIELNDQKSVAEGFRSYREALDSYGSYDRLVAVSETVKQAFCVSSGFEKNRVCVLYNTNESGEIREKACCPVEDTRFDPEGLTLCSVAKIMPSKGYDRLARVHKRLLDEGLLHRIYILGEGEQRAEIESYLRANHLENSFVFLGFQNNPYRYVARCSLYVCSSLREGFSTAVTEALIVGTPAISTRCSGAEELLGEHNEYGIVTENSEEGLYLGLKQLLSDPVLLSRYREKARERGERFDTVETVRAVENMLEELRSE